MKILDEAIEIAEGLRDHCLVGKPPLESTMKLVEGILHYRTYVEELENELKEEARIQGMGGEREARLISELREKQKYILQLEKKIAEERGRTELWRQRIAVFCDEVPIDPIFRDALIYIIAKTVGKVEPCRINGRWVPEDLVEES